jgi:hypothetical protein
VKRDRTLEELQRVSRMREQQLVAPPTKSSLRDLHRMLAAGDEE